MENRIYLLGELAHSISQLSIRHPHATPLGKFKPPLPQPSVVPPSPDQIPIPIATLTDSMDQPLEPSMSMQLSKALGTQVNNHNDDHNTDNDIFYDSSDSRAARIFR